MADRWGHLGSTATLYYRHSFRTMGFPACPKRPDGLGKPFYKTMHQPREESYTLSRPTIAYIQQAAERGLYDIRGLGAKRQLPTFDDLVFLTASLSRYPLEGYR